MTSRKANMDFTNFDQRQYPTVTPKVGYAEWANTYEASVPGLLDIGLLERIHSIRWPETRQCLDLACGTGRTGSLARCERCVADRWGGFHTGNAYAGWDEEGLSALARSLGRKYGTSGCHVRSPHHESGRRTSRSSRTHLP